jgi:hypothetical protein
VAVAEGVAVRVATGIGVGVAVGIGVGVEVGAAVGCPGTVHSGSSLSRAAITGVPSYTRAKPGGKHGRPQLRVAFPSSRRKSSHLFFTAASACAADTIGQYFLASFCWHFVGAGSFPGTGKERSQSAEIL